MKSAQQPHPSAAQLLAFAHGRLDEQQFAEVEAHLGACDACIEWISQQPDNTLLLLAREAATIGTESPACPAVLPRLGEIPTILEDHPRYRVIAPIGIGGMGSVFKAEHRIMQRTVALKIVHPWLLSNEEAVQRFHREVRVAAKLSHPNIVTSFDADQVNDWHFLVMEYVDGESLDAWVTQHGPATVQQACDWIRQAAVGLQHAHEQGMVHRDIKPHNLMLTGDGQIKILDFGLSRLVTEPTIDTSDQPVGGPRPSSTRAGMILGTPDYIAPEQIANSRRADIRADIYSLGCTLYFLLTGRPPFAEGTVVDRLHAHEAAPFPALRQARRDAPAQLEEILRRMTAKQPDERYRAPGELARELAILAGESAAERTDSDSHPVVPLSASVTRLLETARRSSGTSAPSRMSRRVLFSFGGVLVTMALLGLSWSYFGAALSRIWQPRPRMLVMLPSQGLWYPDYEQLVNAARQQRIALTFASLSDRPSDVLQSSPAGIAVPDVGIGPQLRAEDFDAVIFIGYYTQEFSPTGPAGEDTRRLLAEFLRQDKVVASLCAGQRVLAQHGFVRGKTIAACESVSGEEIQAQGGTLSGQNVAVDGQVITAAAPEDANELLKTIQNVREL